MPKNESLIPVEPLKQFLSDLFLASEMTDEEACFCAEALVQTNLWGIDSHGVLRAPVYLKRLFNRAMNPAPNIQKVRGSGAFELLDGDDGIGFVVGRTAMVRAIELAQQFSVGVVGVIRSNHFGAAGLYARMATDQGLISIVMTSVMPNIVAPGGSRPITGNNPIAIGIPTFGDFPFLLDISLSNAAGGKLLLASKKGEKIPFDWATDKDGRPTDDPDAAFAGFLLPLGGHKGLGLSYVVDILSGLITGGAIQHELKSMYKYPDDPSLTCHFMIVINPLILMSQEEMQTRMTAFYQTIKSSPMWDDTKEMMLPGEIEHRTAQARLKTGIPIPAALREELIALGQKHGVVFPG
ncbi:Ldh family oxidoreductase [Candidatus Leptofilum sp.]|uniref:Ldh family oxidoreductase n=1 Tax=Candidatus Leptofilum sp. TaxID=3241576 RepID=UPI003B5A62CB